MAEREGMERGEERDGIKDREPGREGIRVRDQSGRGVQDEGQRRRRELEGTRDWMRLVDKMKGIRRKLELKEREESRNNIVIRRLEGGEGETREREEKVLEEIGAKVEIEWD